MCSAKSVFALPLDPKLTLLWNHSLVDCPASVRTIASFIIHYNAFFQLLQAAESIFAKFLSKSTNSSPDISQLLVVLSDGRGVFADGTYVRQILIAVTEESIAYLYTLFQAVDLTMRRLNEMGVFTVFVILDNLLKVT